LRSSIADYEVIEASPPGGMLAASYLCRPPARLKRTGPVVVSEVAVGADGWAATVDVLVRLARQRVDHLVGLVEAGPDPAGAGAYLVSEPAPGGSLQHPVTPLDEAGRAAAVAVAARAAHALHEIGVAHGSICPAAVVLTGSGPALAPPAPEAAAGLAARAGSWPRLVAVDPDLLRGEAPSRGSDIWSLGATLHGALSQAALYPGIDADPPVTAVQRILFTSPDPDPTLPPRLLAVVRQCLQPDPADRPPTALRVAELVDRSLGATDERAPAPGDGG
jgi:serine/threonine protein kinase